MKKVKEFDSYLDFEFFFGDIKKKFIGSGGEGEVYETDNNEIVKYMKDSYEPKYLSESKDIIMADDIELDSFIFPKELYVVNDQIVGYREDYFKGNVIHFNGGNIKDINIDALERARFRMIKDIEVITFKGYKLEELGRNILFNNKKLCAIDTLDYVKTRNASLEGNVRALDRALALELKSVGGGEFIEQDDSFTMVLRKLRSK